MGRRTSALLTLFIVATILVLTTASQRRNGAIKHDLNNFNADQVLPSDATLAVVPTKPAGKKLRRSLQAAADYDCQDDYCPDAGAGDTADFPCDYEGDYSCLDDQSDTQVTDTSPDTSEDTTDFPCDYEGDYSCLDQADTEEPDTSNDTPSYDTPSPSYDTPSPSYDTPSPSNDPTPSGSSGGSAATPTFVPTATGTAPADGSAQGTVSPGAGTGISTPLTSTAPVAASGAGTGIATPMNSTAAVAAPAPAPSKTVMPVANPTAPGPTAGSSSLTAWSTHSARYTTCITGVTAAIAFAYTFF
jgi:hypothetical protein